MLRCEGFSVLGGGGFLVDQLVRMDLEPNHCPFMAWIAFSASAFLTNETKAYPLDLSVWGSRTMRQLDISPKGAKASRRVSVSISGDRSPTNMWWWLEVSCLGWLPGLVAQLTFISLSRNTRLFIAASAVEADWWLVNSTNAYGSLPGSRMILHPLTGPIWENSVQRRSSDTVESRLPTYKVFGWLSSDMVTPALADGGALTTPHLYNPIAHKAVLLS